MAVPPYLSRQSLTDPAKKDDCASEAPREAKKTAIFLPQSIFDAFFSIRLLAKKESSVAEYPIMNVNGSEIKKIDSATTNIALDCITARIYVAIFMLNVTRVYFFAIPTILL